MDKGENKTLVAKIVCLLLSFGLWFYISNVENPMRTYEIKNVPVELVNVKDLKNSNFSVVSNQNFTVDLKLEGPSTDIIKVKKDDFKIIADMSTYALKEGVNTVPVQILAYPENVTIKNNGFIGIKITLEKYITKEFNIISEVNLSYKENIYEKNKTINPKTVTVSGGKSQVERITKAVLLGTEKDIQSNFTKTYDIKLLDSTGNQVTNVDTNINNAQLTVNVNNGKKVPVNVMITGNTPKGYFIEKSEVSRPIITISGNEDILSKIDKIDTEYIDISNLISNSTFSVKLVIPDGITLKDSENTANVTFTVAQESPINKEISCKVNYVNLPQGFIKENYTENVKVVLTGLKNDLDQIADDNIQVIMDLSKINEGGTFTYTPEVKINTPNNITVNNVESITISIKKQS